MSKLRFTIELLEERKQFIERLKQSRLNDFNKNCIYEESLIESTSDSEIQETLFVIEKGLIACYSIVNDVPLENYDNKRYYLIDKISPFIYKLVSVNSEIFKNLPDDLALKNHEQVMDLIKLCTEAAKEILTLEK